MLPLWFGFLGPPIIWAVRFGVSYALVPSACTGAGLLWMQIVTLVALVGTAWAGVLAWRSWTRAGDADRVEPGGVRVRIRLMGAVGVLGSVLFFLTILVEGLAIFLVPACQSGGVPL
jgi:hypothetical protein